MRQRDFKDYIEDIITSIRDIDQFISGMIYNEFINDKKTYNAVIRSIEIIGEAAKNIPDRIVEKYVDIPWKKMAGMRDKMIHGYFGIDNEILWKTIKDDIPHILPLIENVKVNE